MKEQYEYKVITSEDYRGRLEHYQEDGWEVYKTEVKIKKDFWSQAEIKIWHIKRNITPIKIKVNTTIEVPKYTYDTKKVGGLVVLRDINRYMGKRGLLQ